MKSPVLRRATGSLACVKTIDRGDTRTPPMRAGGRLGGCTPGSAVRALAARSEFAHALHRGGAPTRVRVQSLILILIVVVVVNVVIIAGSLARVERASGY